MDGLSQVAAVFGSAGILPAVFAPGEENRRQDVGATKVLSEPAEIVYSCHGTAIWFGRRSTRPAAPAAHAFAEFLALLGRHLRPPAHHLAAPAEPAAPWPESAEQQPPQYHQSHRLPERDGPQPKESRHQIIPQIRDHESEYREGHDYDGHDF
jgi:hypothetical protein